MTDPSKTTYEEVTRPGDRGGPGPSLQAVAREGRSGFPEGFLWGTATAAYQIEGSVEAGGRGVSIWDTFSHSPGRVHNGDNGDVACDHYARLESDLDLLADLGARAYRFSVAWTRVQPTGSGPANRAGLDFYRRLVDGLRDREIMPVATLYHWDLPQALEDAGGWIERDTAARFGEYVSLVARALGSRVGLWLTLNEPWCSAWHGYASGEHAPGHHDIGRAAAASHHLLLAHGLGLSALRAELDEPRAGITLNLTPVMAASDHDADTAAALRADGNANRMFLDPIAGKGYPRDMLEHYEAKRPGFSVVREGDLEVIAAPIDFLGVNFYAPRTVVSEERVNEANATGYCVSTARRNLVDVDLGVISVRRPDAETTAMGWEVAPAALSELLVRVRDDYGTFPIYITENGAACNDYVDPRGEIRDSERIRYVRAHLEAVLDARDAGVDIRGYFLWSLLDNFEWAYGYSKRFGLTWVDFSSGARIPKASFSWYADTIKHNALVPLPAGALALS
ncbi:MAG: GH1 family beta-glucosidase [Acidimicrobiales bacterium]